MKLRNCKQRYNFSTFNNLLNMLFQVFYQFNYLLKIGFLVVKKRFIPFSHFPEN